MYPAMNRVDMDTPPATVEYTINALVGGSGVRWG